jgi:hypothetical protein
MWLRITVDLDLLIHEAEAVTDAGPYSPCGNITPNFKALKGVTIGPGWRKKTLELLGGIKGLHASGRIARAGRHHRVSGHRQGARTA